MTKRSGAEKHVAGLTGQKESLIQGVGAVKGGEQPPLKRKGGGGGMLAHFESILPNI